MMTTRQQQILTAILKAYVAEAEPISSGHLATETSLQVSPATIRNELSALTDSGYLAQPHTSAGRIPTEKAWRWYVQNLLQTQELSKPSRESLVQVIRSYRSVHAELMRHLARSLADLAKETVVLAPSPTETYYTGLSNLFAQPEFEHVDMIQSVSRVVDRFDDIMEHLFDRLETDVEVLVGKDSPFGPDCGVVVGKYSLPHRSPGLIVILGPLRQDYDEHVAMLKFAADELKHMSPNHD